MKIKRRVCDMCKKDLPMRYGYSKQRYRVKVKLIDTDCVDEDLPIPVKVDLCPNCMRNLCEGVLLLNRKEENDG